VRRGPDEIRGGVAETPMPSCRFALAVRPPLRQFQTGLSVEAGQVTAYATAAKFAWTTSFSPAFSLDAHHFLLVFVGDFPDFGADSRGQIAISQLSKMTRHPSQLAETKFK